MAGSDEPFIHSFLSEKDASGRPPESLYRKQIL